MNQRARSRIWDILTSSPALVVYAGLTCFVLATICINFAHQSRYVSVWVVNAVLLIFIFRSQAKLTWAYFVVGLLVNTIANYNAGGAALLSFGIAASNSVEVLLPILCVRRTDEGQIYIKGLDHQTTMLAISVPLGCLIAAILAASLSINILEKESLSIIFSWFSIDLLSMMAILPMGLSATTERTRKLLQPTNIIELLIVCVVAMSITYASAYYIQIKFIIILMPLLYAAFRLGLLGTSIIFFCTASIYISHIILTGNENTSYANMPELISISSLLMCITLIPALITSILIEQRDEFDEMLQESEARWKFALEGGNQGAWDWDISNNSIYYSRTWKLMLGFQDNEITNKIDEWHLRVHPEDQEIMLFDLNQHLSGKLEEYHCEHRMRCKDGSYKWFVGRGKVITRTTNGMAARVIGTYTDIDEIKKSEEATERLSQRLQLAIDAGHIGIFNFDILNNNVTWDEHMYALYDVTPKTFAHNFSAWESRVHPDDYPRVLNEFNKAIAGTKIFDTEFRIVISGGKIHWIRAKAQVLRDSSGKAITMLGLNWDITSEKQMVHDLHTEKERLSTTLKAIGDAVMVTDENGIITFINPVAEHLIGCDAKTATGKRLYDICKIVSETTDELLENPVDVCLKNKETYYFKEEGVLINYVGTRYFIQDSAAPIILPFGEVAGCVLVFQDVTENRNMQTELRHQATHDVLTGLINRREIESKIKSLISDVRTAKNTNSLFFIDLDNFKVVNDTAGHAAGDELLRRIAEIFTKTVRTTDTVARLGGDEFAIILPECTMEDAMTIANNLINKVLNYKFVWEDKTYDVGASIGLVNFQTKDVTLETLLSHADIACYTAKNNGGNCVSIFEGSDSDASKYLAEIQMGPRIKRAIQNNSFCLYTQEIRPLQSDKKYHTYYEVLLRMQDENGDLIFPEAFIKSAKRQNLMTDIDLLVVKKVLLDAANNINSCNHLSLSINISSSSINSREFHVKLDHYLSETKINKATLGFELQETAFLNDIESSQEFLRIIGKHGCFIVLENFGKGLSSLQYLKNLSKLHIKIDGYFIRGIEKNPIERAIVESINQLAHKLGARTVAEYVESDAIMQVARDIGIDYAQGYSISKPMPLGDLITQLQKHPTHLD